MNVPFVTQEIPRVTTTREVADNFGLMIEQGLPGLIIRSPERLPLMELLGIHREAFADYGFEAQALGALGRIHDADTGLHAGGDVDLEKPTLSFAVAHHTPKGRVEASLFERASERSINVRHATKLFEDGLVDTDILEPVCHRAILTQRQVLIFREAGALPLGHIFKSLTTHRISDRATIKRTV